MKNQIGIWIDSKKATLIKLADGAESLSEIESNIENRIYHNKEGDKGSFFGGSHASNEKSFDERKKQQTADYLKVIRDEIIGLDEIYIIGPAETKNQLKKTIEADNRLTASIKAVESAERMSDNQVIAKVKEFFMA